jgi:hypothetical protein
MFNIVKRRDFMLGQHAQTRQEVEKLLAEKYGQDHIVVEAASHRATRAFRKAGDRLMWQKAPLRPVKRLGKQAGKISFAKRMIVPNKNPSSIPPD